MKVKEEYQISVWKILQSSTVPKCFIHWITQNLDHKMLLFNLKNVFRVLIWTIHYLIYFHNIPCYGPVVGCSFQKAVNTFLCPYCQWEQKNCAAIHGKNFSVCLQFPCGVDFLQNFTYTLFFTTTVKMC